VLTGTKYGVSTDESGFFSLNNIPVGKYTLTLSAMNFETITKSVEVVEGKTVTLSFIMKSSSTVLKGAVIEGARIDTKSDTCVSTITVAPEDIRRLPQIGGEADFAQFLQVLPGVNFTGEQGGQIYIRGGTPVQNKLTIDGLTIYN